EVLHRAGPQVVDEQVAPLDVVLGPGDVLGRLEVERDALLVDVEALERRRRILPERRPPRARIIARLWSLDLEHIGAQHGQNEPGVGSGDVVGKLDDPYPGQRQHGPPSDKTVWRRWAGLPSHCPEHKAPPRSDTPPRRPGRPARPRTPARARPTPPPQPPAPLGAAARPLGRPALWLGVPGRGDVACQAAMRGAKLRPGTPERGRSSPCTRSLSSSSAAAIALASA